MMMKWYATGAIMVVFLYVVAILDTLKSERMKTTCEICECESGMDFRITSFDAFESLSRRDRPIPELQNSTAWRVKP